MLLRRCCGDDVGMLGKERGDDSGMKREGKAVGEQIGCCSCHEFLATGVYFLFNVQTRKHQSPGAACLVVSRNVRTRISLTVVTADDNRYLDIVY